MGLKYRRFGVAAMTGGLILSMAGAGTALAADPFDGVVTVQLVDPDGDPMGGATIRIHYYREGDPIPGIVPLGDPTNADGAAVITGVPYSMDPADPLLLDIRADLSTRVVDDSGCDVFQSWRAESDGVRSEPTLDVVLEMTSSSINVNCPEPTPTAPPAVEPTPRATMVVGADPTPSAAPAVGVNPPPPPSATPAGGVLGAAGGPQVTPPNTDTTVGVASPAASPFVSVILALVALALLIVPAGSLAFARAQARPHSRRNRNR